MFVRPHPALVATTTALVVACSVDVDLAGKRCPCADGWQCDAATSRCVPNGVTISTTAQGPVDIVVPARLRVAQGSSVALTVAAAQADMGKFSVAIEAPAAIAVTPAAADLEAPATVSFDVRPSVDSAIGVVSLNVHAFRSAGEEGVRKRVDLEIDGKPGTADETLGAGGVLVTDIADPFRFALENDRLFVVSFASDTRGCSLARVGMDGKRDGSYGGGGVAWDADYCHVAVHDGAAVLVGETDRGTSFPTHASVIMQRFDANGAVDLTFRGGTPAKFAVDSDNVVSAIAAAADGSVLVAVHSGGPSALFRFDATGAPDATFGAAGQVSLGTFIAETIVPLADGAVLCGGFDPYRKSPLPGEVHRYTKDGKPDPSFGTGGVSLIQTGGTFFNVVALATDGGRVFAIGSDQQAASNAGVAAAIVGLDATGKIDTTFGMNGIARPTIALERFVDGSLLSDGSLVGAGQDSNGAVVARFDGKGIADAAFDGHARFPVGAGFGAERLFVAEQKLLVVGAVGLPIDGGQRAHVLALARYWR